MKPEFYCPICGKPIDKDSVVCDRCWTIAERKGYLKKSTGVIQVPVRSASKPTPDAAMIFLTAAKEAVSIVLWAGFVYSCVGRDAVSAFSFLALRSLLWAMLGSQLRGD